MENREPLYAMISSDGGLWTVVFKPTEKCTHRQVQGYGPSVLDEYIGGASDPVPVIDLRTAKTLRGLTTEVREAQGGPMGGSLPSLDEFMALARAAGATLSTFPARAVRGPSRDMVAVSPTVREDEPIVINGEEFMRETTEFQMRILAWERDNIDETGCYCGPAIPGFRFSPGEHVPMSQRDIAMLQHGMCTRGTATKHPDGKPAARGPTRPTEDIPGQTMLFGSGDSAETKAIKDLAAELCPPARSPEVG